MATPRSSSPGRGAASPVLIVLLICVCIIGAIAVPNLHVARQRGRQKRTTGDMRTLATAMESYSIDNNMYPLTHLREPVNAETLTPLLQPRYVKVLPVRDGWGHPLLVKSSASEYTVTSQGSDGKADGPGDPKPVRNGGITSFRNDIIFSTGSFVQFPDGTMY